MAFNKTKKRWFRTSVENQLSKYSRPSIDFFVLISLSSAIAAVGIALNNIAVIIGAMVVAPLITPVFGFALSLLVLRLKTLFYSLVAIFFGSFIAILVGAILGLGIEGVYRSIDVAAALPAQSETILMFFLVAFFSGMAGAYAYAKPDKKATLPGIAIAVTIIPPLSAIGVTLATGERSLAMSYLSLYIFNLIGIVLGSIIIFTATGFGSDQTKINLKK